MLSGLNAQQFKNNVAAPYLGLSAYSAQLGDVFGMSSNTGALAFMTKTGVGIMAETRFGLIDLTNIGVNGAIAVPKGAIGIQANRFGNNLFNETQVGVGYGRLLTDKIAVGVKANYYQQQINAYGNGSTINAEAGILLQLTPKFKGGVSVYNAVGGKYGINKTESLASIYKLGLGYDVSDKVSISAEVVKMEDVPVNVISSIHYQFENRFFAKAGISAAANNFFAAAGVLISKNIRIDVMASHHQQLGFTPGLVLHISQ
jgi:hypothetical protein